VRGRTVRVRLEQFRDKLTAKLEAAETVRVRLEQFRDKLTAKLEAAETDLRALDLDQAHYSRQVPPHALLASTQAQIQGTQQRIRRLTNLHINTTVLLERAEQTKLDRETLDAFRTMVETFKQQHEETHPDDALQVVSELGVLVADMEKTAERLGDSLDRDLSQTEQDQLMTEVMDEEEEEEGPATAMEEKRPLLSAAIAPPRRAVSFASTLASYSSSSSSSLSSLPMTSLRSSPSTAATTSLRPLPTVASRLLIPPPPPSPTPPILVS
jgi:hypothetical protein